MAFVIDHYFELAPESDIYSDVSILDGNYLYVAEIGWPAKIHKIDLTTETEVSSLTLDPDNIDFCDGNAVIQDSNYIYFGCTSGYSTYKSAIVKIAKSTFTVSGILHISKQYFEWQSHAVYDSIHNKAYFVAYKDIYKINLDTFTLESTLDCGSNYYSISSILIDSTSTFLYIGTNVGYSRIGKISIDSFSIVNYIDTNSHAGISSMAIDNANDKLYAGTYPARDGAGAYIWKIDVATFTSDGELHLPSGEYALTTALIDSTCKYGYFVTWGDKLIRIDLNTFLRVDTITIDETQSRNIHYDSARNIYLVASYDIRIAKITTECQLLPISSILMYKFRPVVLT
jgi:hypothetical protein